MVIIIYSIYSNLYLYTILKGSREREEITMSKSILVVDDDPMNLKMAEFILKQNGFRVFLAKSGMECLDIIRNSQTVLIDLILLDIEMPIMNGIQTFEHIKLDFFDMPVIFLTASGDKNDVMKALKLGAVGYIKKPFLPQDLLERVNSVFDKK